MNRYQQQRISGILKKAGDKLNAPESRFINSIKDTPVVQWPDDDDDELNPEQNTVLNQIAKKYKA